MSFSKGKKKIEKNNGINKIIKSEMANGIKKQ